jgi:hypothetical protein
MKLISFTEETMKPEQPELESGGDLEVLPETNEDDADEQPLANMEEVIAEKSAKDEQRLGEVRQELGLEIGKDVTEIKFENLDPNEAMTRLFAMMDEIKDTGTLSTEKTETVETITALLRSVSKVDDVGAHKLFRADEHFKELMISNKYLIENSLDRDLHEKVITYLQRSGIETTPEEQAQIIEHFKERDAEKRKETMASYAQNGLLTLKSAIESGVLQESSSTPGDFTSMDNLQEFSLDEHSNIRGYELTPDDIGDEMFYGRNGFFRVVLERGGEEIDRAEKLPKEEVENRLRNSMIFILRSDKAEISRRTDNQSKEDIIDRDINPEEIDYLVVDQSNLSIAEEAFGSLPIKIIAAESVEAKLLNMYNGPYDLPDYKDEVEKIAEEEGDIWCHIARLPVDTYPE